MVLEVSLWILRGKIRSRETAYAPMAIIRERNSADWAAPRGMARYLLRVSGFAKMLDMG